MFLRLGGLAPSLPQAPVLALALVTALAIRALLERRARGLPSLPVEGHEFEVALGIVAVLALTIRLASLGADLGHQPLDIDEHRVAANVKDFFTKGEIGYHTVEHYPGILFWLLTGTSSLVYLQGLMNGTFMTVQGMSLEHFVLAGRLTSTAIGVVTTLIVALIGRQLAGPWAGVGAAMLFALAPVSIQTTTALRNDPAQVLFVCAAVHAALASCRSADRRWPLLGGLYAGLATAIKYTSLFAIAPVLLAALVGQPRDGVRRALTAAAAFLVAVLVTNHFLWWDFPNFVRQLSDQVGITGPGHWGAVANPAAYHRMILTDHAIGWLALTVAVGYGVHGLVTGGRYAWVFWTFPLLYSWFTTKRPSQFPRWVFPLLPFVAIAAAAGLTMLVGATRRRLATASSTSRWAVPAASALIVLVALAQPVWKGLSASSRRFTEPTQAKIERWLASRPAGERVLLGQYWLDLKDASLAVTRVSDLGTALDGDLYKLAAYDWVVVPEPLFRRPSLKALSFTERISADHRSFGGNIGYDFEIYAPPRLPPTTGPIDIDFNRRDIEQYLGAEWGVAGPEPGRLVPAGGATVYLPPRVRSSATATIDLAGPLNQPVLILTDAAGLVAVPELTTPQPQQIRLEIRLARDGRSTELRLSPARRNTVVRILRIAID